MEKRGGFSRASSATTLKALSMVVVLIFVSFVNCDLCLLLLIVLYYCRSGRFVRLLVIFFLVVCNLFGRFCVACVGHQ